MGHLKGQKNTLDTIFWNNGDFVLVSELKHVWIIQTNGRIHRRVDIQSIDTASGKLEYYLEGTFHDVLIANIDLITPGKYYRNLIYFKDNKQPVVKYNDLDAIDNDFDAFNNHKRVKPVVAVETKTVQVEQTITNSSETFDEIIFSSGKTLLVKVISIIDGKLNYKRADLLDGPTYIVSLTIPGTLTSAKITNSGHKIIDYRH